jgi:signal transduction histidine kinase
MFRSARWSLTLFYLGIIVLFNLVVTLSIRLYAEHEFLRSYAVQTSEVREWVRQSPQAAGRMLDDAIADIRESQIRIVRQNLNGGLFVINLGALVIGGVLSHWFAGRALRPIEETHEAQARFTADASHEMRTPLANMRLENEVFLRQKSFSEKEARALLASNLEEVQRLERLSNNLLSLHQYGQNALLRGPVAIENVVNDALEQLAVAAANRKMKVKLHISPARVVGHYDSLVQLVGILLDNAIKYGGSGGEVTVIGERKGWRYVVRVEDKGPGIAAHDLPHVFDRLYRGDKARSGKVSGYGLGLALAKEIVQANGAVIVAHNKAAGGACFEVALELTT